MMKKANGEFEEAVVAGLDEIKAELRRTNQRLGETNARQDALNERQDILNERQGLQSERQSLLHEQVVATDKKVDRVITVLTTLLEKVERFS